MIVAICRYGYHIGLVSYYLCYDPVVIQRIFKRLRNFDGTERSVTTNNPWQSMLLPYVSINVCID